MKTEFKDYTLWWNGIIEVKPEKVEDLILNGVEPDKISVDQMTPDIESFNRLNPSKIKVNNELSSEDFSHHWRIPEPYASLNLLEYVNGTLLDKIPQDEFFDERVDRVLVEMDHYIDQGFTNLLRTLIYIIDTFKEKDVVWGVGRGSSCASYLLYLIGIHSVDPVKYNIPLSEFFKD